MNKIKDGLSKLTSSSELTKCIIQEIKTIFSLEEVVVAKIDTEDLLGQMEEMIQYLKKSELPKSTIEAK